MLTKLTDRRALRRWSRAVETIDHLDPVQAKSLQREAARLSKRLNRVLNAVEDRIAIAPFASNDPERPLHADWVWRPALWAGPLAVPGAAAVQNGTRLTDDSAVFHDCAMNEITLRQTRAPAGARPGYAATLDTLDFSGSYLSLAIDLPHNALRGLSTTHIISMRADIACERPVDIYARLNLGYGPNVDSLIEAYSPEFTHSGFEFDLARSEVDESRLDRAWIDLIFDAPAFNHFQVQGVELTRRPRADL